VASGFGCSISTVEGNSNFGGVFAFWDRLFGTYARPLSPEPVYGVAELPRADACHPIPMLLTPWRIR